MSDDTIETRIAGFLARYAPEREAQLREARARLRAAFPRGYELVFDNYNALVFGISASGRTSESFVSITGYPRWTTLFFLNGASLDDAEGLLEGEGKQIRGLRLESPADFDSPAVQALLRQAMLPYEAAFAAAPKLSTEIRMEAAKQRPRR